MVLKVVKKNLKTFQKQIFVLFLLCTHWGNKTHLMDKLSCYWTSYT